MKEGEEAKNKEIRKSGRGELKRKAKGKKRIVGKGREGGKMYRREKEKEMEATAGACQ